MDCYTDFAKLPLAELVSAHRVEIGSIVGFPQPIALAEQLRHVRARVSSPAVSIGLPETARTKEAELAQSLPLEDAPARHG